MIPTSMATLALSIIRVIFSDMLEMFTTIGIYVSSIIGIITILSYFTKFIKWLIKKLFFQNQIDDIANNLKLKKEFFNKFNWKTPYETENEAIIRNVNNDTYPKTDNDNNFRCSNWFKTEIKGIYEHGIEVFIGYPNYMYFFREKLLLVKVSETDKEKYKAELVYKIGRIPYKFISNLDWDGDNNYNFLHIYCSYNGFLKSPYEDFKYYYLIDNFYWEIDNYDILRKEYSFFKKYWLNIRTFINR